MSASYNKIDYRLRIAKSVERRILCSVFQHLYVFNPVEAYKYVGFGSVSFLDFSLFHRSLGISNMISIEREVHDKARFEFNKPYDCIDIKYGESEDVLPRIDIESNAIVWLDYDDKLTTSILSDMSLVFNRLTSGSFFCVSYNAHQDNEEDGKSRFDQLSERVDNKYFPKYIYGNYLLNKKNLRIAYYDIINNLIQEVVSIRRTNGEDINLQQMLFINYNDGTEMNTLGWLFYSNPDKSKMESIIDKKFSFTRIDKNPFEIRVPALTYKEIRAIEERFPDIDNCLKHFRKDGKGNGMLSQSDIEDYFNIYKNFSLFAEISI